jgi:CRP-like cAMP-binding protein
LNNLHDDSKRTKQLKLARSLLERCLGFKECLPETIDALLNEANLKSLSKGEVLAHHNQHFDFLCLVVEGSLESSIVRDDGHRHLVHFLQPGDLVGVINLIDMQGQINNLASRFAGTTLLLIPGTPVRLLKKNAPDLSHALEMQMAFRSRLLYARLASDTSISFEARLARLLLTLANLYGLERSEGILLDVRISQEDLGDWLGVSRQRVNIATQLLKNEGLIDMSYSSITITRMDELKKRASR